MFKTFFKYKILLFILLVTQHPINAQKTLYFKRYNIYDGLSQNSVYGIAQDKNDFIWLATGKGLNRFDGYDFINYYHNPKDSNSLSHSRVLDVEVDKWNRLWLATNEGVNCYDQGNDIFYHFRKKDNDSTSLSEDMVKDILIDKEGFLWVATRNGLNVSRQPLDSIKNLAKPIKFHRIPKEQMSNNLIIRLLEDQSGNILAATINGLNRINKKTFEIKQYYPGGKNKNSSPNWISSLAIAENNSIWIGTRSGLFLLHDDTITSYNNHPFFKKNINAKGISSLLKDKFGRLWIGSFTEGLILFDIKNNKFTTYKNSKSNLFSLANNHAYYLFVNKHNDLFVSSFAKGFAITNIEPVKFHNYLYDSENKENTYKIRRIIHDKENNLWLGMHEDGLYHLNLKNNKFKKYKLGLSKKNEPLTVKCILDNKNQTLWIGTLSKGLHLFDIKRNKIKRELKFNNKSIETVFDLKKDKQGNLWIASWTQGLFKYETNTKKIIHYQKEENNDNSLNNNNITSILIVDDDEIWLTTWGGGINILNPKTENFKHYTSHNDSEFKIPSDYCTVLFQDKRGFYWVGSTEGLFKIDEQKNTVTTFRSQSVIDNEIIYSIEGDDNSNLWIGTNYGINRFSTLNSSVVNYEESDGIPSNEYYIGASCKLPDGRLVFGSKNGVLVFYPDSISAMSYNFSVNITNFQISYKDIKPHIRYQGEEILKKSILATDTIELSYKNNILSFEFSAANYTKPENIQYAYILEGFNTEWNYVDARKRFAVYTNLEPGTYTFKVKATKLDGTWNPKIGKLTIIINSPFWKTKFFVIFLFIFILVVVILFFKIKNQYTLKQKQQLKKLVQQRTQELEIKNTELIKQKEEIAFQKEELFTLSEQLQELNKGLESKVKERTQKLKEALVKAEASEKMISSFLANFSHEIRTPMNAIAGFAQLFSSAEISDETRKKYSGIINTNIDILLHLIENVMEVAKLRSGEYKGVKNSFRLDTMCINIYHDLKPLLNNKDINFITELDTIKDLKLYSDQRAFHHIIYNLLENAFKYTEKGIVKLSCFYDIDKNSTQNHLQTVNNQAEGFLKIVVSDTGIGIKKENLKNIFYVFSKPEESKKKVIRGTGLGLALVKELCNQLNATINLESELNKGTTVSLTIPVSKFKPKN